jgi:hypothetical protein
MKHYKIKIPLILFLVFLVGVFTGRSGRPQIDWDNPPENVIIPSVSQLQRIVGCEKVDGKPCKSFHVEDHSETWEKWDDYICNQEARKWDFYYEYQSQRQ